MVLEAHIQIRICRPLTSQAASHRSQVEARHPHGDDAADTTLNIRWSCRKRLGNRDRKNFSGAFSKRDLAGGKWLFSAFCK